MILLTLKDDASVDALEQVLIRKGFSIKNKMTRIGVWVVSAPNEVLQETFGIEVSKGKEAVHNINHGSYEMDQVFMSGTIKIPEDLSGLGVGGAELNKRVGLTD